MTTEDKYEYDNDDDEAPVLGMYTITHDTCSDEQPDVAEGKYVGTAGTPVGAGDMLYEYTAAYLSDDADLYLEDTDNAIPYEMFEAMRPNSSRIFLFCDERFIVTLVVNQWEDA